MPQNYKGDVTPRECWEALADDPNAFLVDVRTTAEWTYVGLPDLTAVQRQPLLVEWQRFPSMAVDPLFTEKLGGAIEMAGGDRQSRLFFLCRSGVRSIASAAAMTEIGFANCYNVLDGFEGAPDEAGHRATKAGWKAEGLPWVQR
ncbi:rhodanese-like domain-containing protein [Consotaella aegiceratis]|uniref:rhodanese-like domain-containing protein n=1 Tax=Consotaella aegiceratis TaxID=3097961 RepID=UPI002F409AE2